MAKWIVIAFLFASYVAAHPVLVPRPTLTLADRVLLSDALVLAREDSERPFHYAIVKTIKGDPGTAPIDLFVPTQIRRKLAINSESSMLLGRDSKNGKWGTLGYATDEYLEVVNQVLASADSWTPRETDNEQRMTAFVPLLGHADVRLHELAYVEIGRASYEAIKRVGASLPMERVRAMFQNPLYYEWRGLDIMLLGLSGEEQDRVQVLRQMESSQKLASETDLAAWATAYIEITGEEGMDQLINWYFLNPERSREELRSVTRAMAGHANESLALREPTIAAYHTLLDQRPKMASDIAHDLIAWQRWEFYERITKLRPQLARTDPLGVTKVDLYLRRARANQ